MCLGFEVFMCLCVYVFMYLCIELHNIIESNYF